MGQNAPEALEGSGTITVARFLAQLPDGVRVLHDAGDRPLRWVEPSELADPTPYLMDYELLLTSGLPFREDAGASADGFVERLVAAKVSALGFGLEPYFTGLPPQLIEACERHGLTLWEIPPSLPFAALGLSFARMLESENAVMLRDVAETSRQLLRAVLGERSEQDLLDVLARRTKARLELYGSRGQLRFTAGHRHALAPSVEETVEETVAELLGPMLAGSGPRVELRETPDGVLVAFPLRSATQRSQGAHRADSVRERRPEATLGVLVLALPHALSTAEHSIVSTAVGLLEVLARQRAAGALSPSQLAAALVLGTREPVPRLLAESVGGPKRAPLRVVVGARLGPDSPAADLNRDVLEWRRLWDSRLVLHEGTSMCAITRLQPSDETLAAALKAGYAVAVSAPLGSGTQDDGALAALRDQALALLPRAVDERRGLRAEDSPPSFLGLLGPEAGRLLAREILAPLTDLDARGELLVRVLRAWLDANGSWDASATALGLHRNSVRRHVAAIGELLGRDLQDAGVRAELWMALRFVPG